MPDPDQIAAEPADSQRLAPAAPLPAADPRPANHHQRMHLTGTLADGGLRTLLQRADLWPEALARRLNVLARELGMPRQVDKKTPYKWLCGSVPRDPWPAL